MQAKELRRQTNISGETIVEIEVENMRVRLTSTYDGKATFDEVIYILACDKLADRIA